MTPENAAVVCRFLKSTAKALTADPAIHHVVAVAEHLAKIADSGHVVSGTEARVCELIAKRQQLGIHKYGTTVANNPLAQAAWIKHALEETLDQAIYLQRALEEIEAMPVVTARFANDVRIAIDAPHPRVCFGDTITIAAINGKSPNPSPANKENV